MSWTIEGSGGAQWSAAAWVGRNAMFFLTPALRAAHLDSAAAVLDEASASGLCRASLRDVLSTERNSHLFKTAVDAALARIEDEGAAGWHDPHAYVPFVAAFRKLKTLGRADGNELVIELAANPLNFSRDHVIGSAEAIPH